MPENIEGAPNPLTENAPPLADAPAEEPAAPVADASNKEDVTSHDVQVDKNGDKIYPSLYDTLPTTFGAIALGIIIIGTIQWVVKKIYDNQKKESKALTQFVTAMFALIVGIWIADKLIAGPSAQLLYETESREVLTFIKDITLMVFAYYFGTKNQSEKSDGVDS